jgi:hypothetical protein
MSRRISPLLCELHAHTTWSDGALSLTELVELYGRNGFVVLCVTDHLARDGRQYVHAGNYGAYLGAIPRLSRRGRTSETATSAPGHPCRAPNGRG